MALLKEKLKTKYKQDFAEKEEVRKLKDQSKKLAMDNRECTAAVFDLQQVMYLPKSNEIRQDNESEPSINWTDMVEIEVRKSNPKKIFSRHSTWTKDKDDSFQKPIPVLNNESPKTLVKKYLISLCQGTKPVIRHSENDPYKIEEIVSEVNVVLRIRGKDVKMDVNRNKEVAEPQNKEESEDSAE
ncbi:hypothetical protein J6590_096008 [Homalodisca vitripennis]|nr:hypothetical protein J6590_096008 [Homalodisca vitripennis]